MGGGKKNIPVVYDMLVFENRQIFYLINNIPNEITCKNINIHDSENTIQIKSNFYLLSKCNSKFLIISQQSY